MRPSLLTLNDDSFFKGTSFPLHSGHLFIFLYFPLFYFLMVTSHFKEVSFGSRLLCTPTTLLSSNDFPPFFHFFSFLVFIFTVGKVYRLTFFLTFTPYFPARIIRPSTIGLFTPTSADKFIHYLLLLLISEIDFQITLNK